MNTDPYVLAFQSFISIVCRRLVEKEVFTRQEMVDLCDAWFGDVLSIASALEKNGAERDIDQVLEMIHRMAVEFNTPK